ncbi:hypothetical protein CEK26_003483 [Fusarium fujikuroi]|nr:hypothetical protein CEK27_003475 [Fusarium fujikuroi]QGI88481.1 hypothetical protein CEK25_003437 [Fusarium fujikuroi]QGJ02039.1 hypothetical protein CEK26_003483 [Fusarium fujikuroi]
MQFNTKTALAIFGMATVASAQQQCIQAPANNQCPDSHPKFCSTASGTGVIFTACLLHGQVTDWP